MVRTCRTVCLDCIIIYLRVYRYVLLRKFVINPQKSLCNSCEEKGTESITDGHQKEYKLRNERSKNNEE